MRVLCLMLCGFSMVGCFTSTPVRDAPLPPAQQSELQCLLEGTWRLTETDGEPFRVSDQRWIFQTDGAGEYRQGPGTGDGAQFVVAANSPYRWTLDGRNITLSMDGRTTVYRADAFSTGRMTWFNYTMSGMYTVERVGEARSNCAAP